MDNLDDSETNAKISDSAYSNSCSNSQSRRSHSSKSTHSESNSSGSSGYGGKPSTSGYSNNLGQQPEKRTKDKEAKKKKKVKIETNLTETKKENEWPPAPVFESPKEDIKDDSPKTNTIFGLREYLDVIARWQEISKKAEKNNQSRGYTINTAYHS